MATATVTPTPSKKFAAPAAAAKKTAAKKEVAAPAKFTGKVAPVASAKTAPAKTAPAKTALAKTERAPRGSSYSGTKIKVLNKEHGAREGTKRAQGMDIILKSKTYDDAVAKLVEIGADASFIRFAVQSGFVELV